MSVCDYTPSGVLVITYHNCILSFFGTWRLYMSNYFTRTVTADNSIKEGTVEKHYK